MINYSTIEDDIDDLTMANLVESQIQSLPLTREELKVLDIVLKNDALRFEYYGLISIMQNFDATTPQADLLYQMEDVAGGVHLVKDNQICQQDYLIEYGAKTIGVAPASKMNPANQQYILYDLGLVLNFNDFRQARLAAHLPETFEKQVAETKNRYGYEAPDLTKWTLQLEDQNGQITHQKFGVDGTLNINLNNIINWQLVKTE